MQKRIKKKIEEARLRSRQKNRPYLIAATGRGRVKCHADIPDLNCPRCRHRIIVRSLRARKATANAACSPHVSTVGQPVDACSANPGPNSSATIHE